MENFNIVGKGAKNTEMRHDNDSFLTETIYRSSKPVEGELAKTEIEKKMVMMVDILLEEEFENLGLEYDHFVDENQVHVINESKKEKYIDSTADAVYDSAHQQIFLSPESENNSRANQFHHLLHESIHAVSYHKYFLQENGELDNYRIGYRVDHPNKDTVRFKALNEAVTERIALEIIDLKKRVLMEELSVSEEDFDESYISYSDEVDILESIIDSMSESTGESFKEIWIKFKKSLFSGEMMFLRDIEKVFGVNSLKVLANIKTHYKKEESNIFELHKLYFSNKLSSEERDLITSRILNEAVKYE